jgi:hypothetical protein
MNNTSGIGGRFCIRRSSLKLRIDVGDLVQSAFDACCYSAFEIGDFHDAQIDLVIPLYATAMPMSCKVMPRFVCSSDHYPL